MRPVYSYQVPSHVERKDALPRLGLHISPYLVRIQGRSQRNSLRRILPSYDHGQTGTQPQSTDRCQRRRHIETHIVGSSGTLMCYHKGSKYRPPNEVITAASVGTRRLGRGWSTAAGCRFYRPVTRLGTGSWRACQAVTFPINTRTGESRLEIEHEAECQRYRSGCPS